MPNQEIVILFPICACMTLVTLVLTQASLGPGYSIPHLGLTLTRDLGPIRGLKLNWLLWFPSGPHPYLVTLVTPWDSLGPGESGPKLVRTWIWRLDATWASPGFGESCCHLRLTWTF